MVPSDTPDTQTLADQLAQTRQKLAQEAPHELIVKDAELLDLLNKQYIGSQAPQAGDAAPEFTLIVANNIPVGLRAHRAPKEGQTISDFILPDENARPIRLSDVLQQGPVVLAFNRGAWCFFCSLQLDVYQAFLPQIKQAGATLLAISPQIDENARAMSSRYHLTFPLLRDEGNVIARQYGLVYEIPEEHRPIWRETIADLAEFNGEDSWSLPIPGTFIIDQDRVVRYAFVNTDYTQRLEPTEIVLRLRQLRKQ